MTERWYLGCDHEGPDGLRVSGTWFTDQGQMLETLKRELAVGFYTKFTIRQGRSPARTHHPSRQAQVDAWYAKTFEEPA